MCDQLLIKTDNDYCRLNEYLESIGAKKAMLVLDSIVPHLKIYPYLKDLQVKTVIFTDFSSNPDYEAVRKGTRLFLAEKCDCIIAIGGGSCIDTAKCIKLFAVLDIRMEFLEQPLAESGIPLIAMPTTAGSGSEATRYAVVYRNGEKQTVTQKSCIPDLVIFDVSVLDDLPEYQKKSCMLDALCHGIESMWSINSNEESRGYSKEVISFIINHYKAYLAGNAAVAEKMLEMANKAGKAINIAQTTAGHAMSYKLTSLYGIAHGYAAALCLTGVLEFAAGHMEKCIDKRGTAYLESVLLEIAFLMGCKNISAAVGYLKSLLHELGMDPPCAVSEWDIDMLKKSVNKDRLKNNPVALDSEDIGGIYRKILC